MEKKKYKGIDLFCGIGGFRLAMKENNVQCVFSSDIDKFARETYSANFYDVPVGDITRVDVSDIPSFDILTAGFPCQPFSIAGKREGFKDLTRGTLFFDIADIISRTKPKAFLLENVEGILTHQKGKTFEIILETLVNELGYEVVGVEKTLFGKLQYNKDAFLRSAKDFGIPQRRLRTYIIGFRKDLLQDNNFILEPLPKNRTDLKIYKNLNDLLEFQNDIKYYVASGYLKTLERHKLKHSLKGNGFGFEVVNAPNIKNPIANTILATGGSGKERNLVYDPQDKINGKIVKNKRFY